MLTDQIFFLENCIDFGGCCSFTFCFSKLFWFEAAMNMIKFITLEIEIKYQENMGWVWFY